MNFKLYISTLVFFLFFSCSNQKKEIDFPISKVANFDIDNNDENYLINVSRFENGEYKIEYRNTLITKLDSTLHSKIINLKEKNSRIHEYATVKLELDKQIPYREFKILTHEFRKAFHQLFVLKTNGNEYLRIQLLPEYQDINEYYDDRIKGLGPPHSLFEELKPFFTDNKILYATIKNGELDLIDNMGNQISDYKNYAFENKRFITLYEIQDEQSYQDFVTLYSQLIEWHNEIKQIIDKNAGKKQDLDEYKFLIAEKTHHNIGYK